MSAELDPSTLVWSGSQPEAPSPARTSDGWGHTEIVLAGSAIVLLIVVAYLVFADDASGAEGHTGREETTSYRRFS